MKGNLWRMFWVGVIIVGAVLLWHFGFEPSIGAQAEVAAKGWEYKGEISLTNEQYNQLKDDIASRDASIQTRSDLIIIGVNSDGTAQVRYDFYSAKEYSRLTKLKPPSFFGVPSGIVPILYWAMIMLIILRILFDDAKPNKVETTKESVA